MLASVAAPASMLVSVSTESTYEAARPTIYQFAIPCPFVPTRVFVNTHRLSTAPIFPAARFRASFHFQKLWWLLAHFYLFIRSLGYLS